MHYENTIFIANKNLGNSQPFRICLMPTVIYFIYLNLTTLRLWNCTLGKFLTKSLLDSHWWSIKDVRKQQNVISWDIFLNHHCLLNSAALF